jgi:S1-C subfamily serine protease
VDAEVVGEDASTDLALLRVEPGDVKSGLHPLPLGSSEGLRVGEPAVALGSPFGFAGTVTTGIVSALDRDIRAPNGFTIDGVVQTDAAINPGNSGGPLLDGDGKVIGVNAQIATDGTRANSGVGFAIPVDVAREVIPELQKDGEVERPWLGVSSGPRPSGAAGAVVARIVPDSPAAKAGIRSDDVIIGADGDDVAEPQDIADAIEDNAPGDTVEITLRRDGDERTVEVKLGTRPEEVDG